MRTHRDAHEGQPAPALVTLPDIEAAAARIRTVARLTPLLEVPWPLPGTDGRGTGRLFVKCENLQPMGAFKIRGAFNMIAQLSRDELSRGVITYSSGNHGQAVALAARELGARAVIVMPTTAPAVKVEGARGYGAEVVWAGTTSLERKARAEEIAAERGLVMVPPFDHPMIIAGQGTVALEILDQCPEVATVIVAVGGGGLSSGVSAAIKRRAPHVRVVGVEPDGAPKMTRSLEAGAPVTLDRVATVADGLMTVRPGEITFEHVRTFVDEVVTVSDEAIVRAVGWLCRHARLVVEPSGAAATAALMCGLGGVDPARGPVVAIISGGNVEPERFAVYINSK
jgi:threonine dehydratase